MPFCTDCDRTVKTLVPSRRFLGLATDKPSIDSTPKCRRCADNASTRWDDILAGVRHNLIFDLGTGPSRLSDPIIDESSLAMQTVAQRLVATR